jgi:hypothetical protein
MADSQLPRADNWSQGVNNLTPRDNLPAGFVAKSLNLDPLPSGALRLRPNRTRVATLVNARGVLRYGDRLIIADGADLKQYDPQDNALRVLDGAIAPSGFFAGAELNGELFFCTPLGRHRLRGETLLPWGMDPVVCQITTGPGELEAGVYRVGVTGVSADGVESGCVPTVVHLPAGSGLVVTPTLPAGAVLARVYLSVANGETLFLQDERIGVSVLTYVRNNTAVLGTANRATPPLGDQIVRHHSRLLIANGNLLYFTEPFAPHLYNRLGGFIAYAKPISAVVSVGELVYLVAGDQTYRITDLGTPQQRSVPIQPATRAVKGSALVRPDGVGVWMTPYGQALAKPDGTVEMPNRTSYAPALAEYASAGVVQYRGNEVVVTAMRGKASASTLGMSDYIDGEFEP